MEEEKQSITQRLNALEKSSSDKVKEKKFRMPFTAKVGKMKLKQGYATIMQINENNSCVFTKKQIVDSTIKLDDTFHATDSEDVLTFKGKPLLIIPKKRKNPYNPNRKENETYGQKHIQSRMLNETIKLGKKMSLGMSIGALIILGVIVYALFMG